MAFKRKLTFCVGMMAVLLWGTVSEAQVSKRYGKAVRNKFTKLNPYKIGQFDYKRPYSFLKGRDWRLKLLTPIYDTTVYTESPLDREQKFEGFESGATPYSLYLSYKWLGIGETALAYTIQTTPNFKYRFTMKSQDIGMTFGLQKRFLYRKGKRKFGGISSVYRSNLTLGYGKMTEGTATIVYIIEGVGGQKTTETFVGEYTKGNAWFIIYGWEIYQGESISIEAAASYRENNVIYSPPVSVIEGSSYQTNVPIKGDFNQVMFGFGISF